MKLTLFFMFAFLHGFGQSVSIYNFQFASLDNRSHSLSEFKGKRIMIFILPSSQSAADSATLFVVNRFATQNTNNVIIIAVPSVEDGYATNASVNLNSWYKNSLPSNVIITSGMNSRKSNANQDPILTWLTHASKNGHFDQDITGPGQIYFIKETGQLYGEIAPEVIITGQILSKILTQP